MPRISSTLVISEIVGTACRCCAGRFMLGPRHDHRVLVIVGVDVSVGVAAGAHMPSLGRSESAESAVRPHA